MMKLTLPFIIYLSYQTIVYACSDFLNKKDSTLIISLGQTCLLEDDTISSITFKTIKIEGTLSIQDNVSLYIKYQSLSIGEKGSLEVGKDSAIINSLIVFEDVGDQTCQEPPNTQSVGKINVISRYFDTISFSELTQSSKKIKSSSKPSNILSKQNYLLQDQFSTEYPELLQIQDVKEYSIYLQEGLKKNYFQVESRNEYIIQPFLFSDVPTISGVIFKNSCITGNIDKFQGVTLLNPRGLFFKGNLIQGSLIKMDGTKGQIINRTFNSEGGFQRNIFFNCQDLTISNNYDDERSFSENIISNSKNISIKTNGYYLKNNRIINSKVSFISQKDSIHFQTFFSFNSEISINNKENSNIYFYEKSVIFKSMTIDVMKTVKEFKITSSWFFSTSLDFSKSIITKTFLVSRSVIDGNFEQDHFAIMQKSSTQQSINLDDSTFVGYKSYLITTSDKLKLPQQQQYFSRLFGETLFKISIDYITTNMKDTTPIFNLPLMNLKYSRSDSNVVVQIDDKNLENQYLVYSKTTWAPIPTYELSQIPTYFKLKNLIPLNSASNGQLKVKISSNGQSKYSLDLNSYTQIIRDQIMQIHIENNNGQNEDLSEFTIEFNQTEQTQYQSEEKIISFTQTQRAIKSITAVEIQSDNSEKSVEVKINYNDSGYYDPIFNWIQNQNQFSFFLKDLKTVAFYKVKFEYCAENEKFDGKSCVATCPLSQTGFFCSKECIDGYFKDPNNPSICLKCPFGCSSCSNETTCTKCFKQYILDDSKCIDVCGKSYVYENNSCKKCGEGCLQCRYSNRCNECADVGAYYTNGKCSKCQINQAQKYECENCPKQCKTCIHTDAYGCIECADGYERVLGQCREIRQPPVVQQECEDGYSFIKGSCQKCYQGCLTCTEHNYSSQCTSCTTAYKLGYFGSDCEKCKVGEFGDYKSCQQCNSLCDKSQSCQGPSIYQCQKCISGYFKHPTNNKCTSCNLNKCKECSEEPTKCIDCDENKVLFDSQCFDKCPSGFYPDEKRVCLPCEKLRCKECAKSPTQCTECKFGEVLFEEKCYKRCQDGYFADKDSVCRKCDLNKCEECIQYETKCTKCKPNLYLINHSCEESCPDKGYFFDTKNQCQPCHEDCEKCTDIPTKCTDCEYPMYLENNKCLQECPIGKYGAYIQSISKCVDCDTSKCKTCVDHRQKCTSCQDGYYLHKNQCLKECPEGTNKNEVTMSCLICLQPHCEVCGDNIGYCQACIKGYYQHEGLCTKECPFGYFLNVDEKKCQECDKRVCMECRESPTQCTKCYPEHFNIGNGSCSTSCPKMMYPFSEGSQQVCKPCDPVCTKGCVGPLESECLEAVYITQEAKNEAYLIVLVVICFILLIGLIGLAYLYYKKRKAPYKPYLLQRASQSDIGTVIQMENTDSIKRL